MSLIISLCCQPPFQYLHLPVFPVHTAITNYAFRQWHRARVINRVCFCDDVLANQRGTAVIWEKWHKNARFQEESQLQLPPFRLGDAAAFCFIVAMQKHSAPIGNVLASEQFIYQRIMHFRHKQSLAFRGLACVNKPSTFHVATCRSTA